MSKEQCSAKIHIKSFLTAADSGFIAASSQRVEYYLVLSLTEHAAVFTSALKVLSSSAPRAPSAHMDSARTVRLQSNQKQLFREVEAMVWARGKSVGVRRGSVSAVYDALEEFLVAIMLVNAVKALIIKTAVNYFLARMLQQSSTEHLHPGKGLHFRFTVRAVLQTDPP